MQKKQEHGIERNKMKGDQNSVRGCRRFFRMLARIWPLYLSVLLIITSGYIYLRYFWSNRGVLSSVHRSVAELLSRKVNIGGVSLSWRGLLLENVTVYRRNREKTVLLRIDRLYGRPRLTPLLRGRLIIGEVTIEGVRYYRSEDAVSSAAKRRQRSPGASLGKIPLTFQVNTINVRNAEIRGGKNRLARLSGECHFQSGEDSVGGSFRFRMDALNMPTLILKGDWRNNEADWRIRGMTWSDYKNNRTMYGFFEGRVYQNGRIYLNFSPKQFNTFFLRRVWPRPVRFSCHTEGTIRLRTSFSSLTTIHVEGKIQGHKGVLRLPFVKRALDVPRITASYRLGFLHLNQVVLDLGENTAVADLRIPLVSSLPRHVHLDIQSRSLRLSSLIDEISPRGTSQKMNSPKRPGKYRFSGRLNIGSLRYKKTVFDHIQVKYVYNGKSFHFPSIRSAFCGGTISGSAALSDNQNCSFQTQFNGVRLTRLMKMYVPRIVMYGSLQGTLSGDFILQRPAASLRLKGRMTARNGEIRNTGIQNALNQYLKGDILKNIYFHSIQLHGGMKKGEVSLNNATIRAEELSARANGSIPDKGEIQLVMHARVSDRAYRTVPNPAKLLLNRDRRFSVRINGNLQKPIISDIQIK